MSILSALGTLVRDLVAQGVASAEAIVERVKTLYGGDRETRRRVAFSVAMIALSAKMAKADGVVSQSEVDAFQRIFVIPPHEVRNVFRLYDLAKQDTAGFEAYAAQMAKLCEAQEGEQSLLVDVLDGLFHVAGADGVVHERELAFLRRIADIFALSQAEFAQIEARHVRGRAGRAFAILGAEPDDPPEEVRRKYLKLVRENHPDRLAARGVPQEFMAIATERMKAINEAWSTVSKAAPAV
ncbi:TerB family tellurite resistance protein [Aureimonas populi]|uniref:TerB family tellurite resistance protein n=1 Tax=Aureimonas populi TaxID=1701758 RepID=A0ABW5CMZ8_9HYPH